MMEIKQRFKADPKLKLMGQVRQVLRYHHYAYQTEKTYCDWIVRYIRFHGSKKHPKNMGKSEIESFLSHLAVNRNVSASTQRQALNAIVFLYHRVLDIDITDRIDHVKAKRHRRPPVVLSQSEVKRVLAQLKGIHQIMARLLYGGGLRLMECVRLRVQDFDIERNMIYVRAAKGGKDRTTLFPMLLKSDIQDQLEKVKNLHDEDLASGYGEVYMPFALARKYPKAAFEYRWQFVFPSRKLSIDPRTGKRRRHHVQHSGLQKAVKTAVGRARILKRVGTHTFRHSFATHLLENGVNIRVVQELMGHHDVKTTEIYTHVMDKNLFSLTSPLDALRDSS
jgi:integron integrase